jgi:hypothetical protein
LQLDEQSLKRRIDVHNEKQQSNHGCPESRAAQRFPVMMPIKRADESSVACWAPSPSIDPQAPEENG